MSTTVVSTSVAAVMVSVVAGVSAMVVASDAQMIVIIGDMSCGTPRDQSFVQAAVRVLSPAAWGDTYVALVGGNLAMLGAALLLQVNNLNNAPYQTMQGDAFTGGSYAPERYTTYGRQVLLGLNYKL